MGLRDTVDSQRITTEADSDLDPDEMLRSLPCVDAKHRRIAEVTYAWIAQRGLYPHENAETRSRERARRSLVASTFSYFCSPPDAEGSGIAGSGGDPLSGYYLAAKFVTVLFLLDDARDAAELIGVSNRIREHHTHEHSAASDTTQAACLALLDELRACTAGLEHFYSAFLDLCDYMQRDLDPGELDPDTLLEIREITIAVPLFAALWEDLGAVRLTKEEHALVEPLQKKAARLATITNDLGSLKRDLESSAHPRTDRSDPNIVIAISKAKGTSLKDAKESILRLHNGLVMEFETERERWFACGSADMRRYLNSLARCVNGNLACTTYLQSIRYSPEPYLALARQVSERSCFFGP